jgi:PAS domain S-box-containing protein
MPEQTHDTILLVDDDEVKRYTVGKILQKAGFEVRETATGQDALRLIADRPAMVILDVKLPDMSGFEVCRIIKSDPVTRSIPVLHISTTFVEIEDKVQGLEGGADGYLVDVMEPLELIATVNALLRARKAEEAADLTARQWQTTFDAVSDGVILFRGDGTIVQVNQALERILGRSWNELIGREFHALLELPLDPKHSPFLKMLESRQRESVELSRDDQWLEVAIDPIKGGDNQVKGALGIVSDITERKRLEEERIRLLEREQRARLEAENASQAKDQFLAVLSHELRTPLNPVLLAVTAMIDQPPSPEELRPMLEMIRDNITLQSRLIDDLLDVMRIVRGKMPLEWSVVDCHDLIRRAVEICRADLGSHKLTIVLDLAASEHYVHADPARLNQVLWNLIKNAVKFTPAGGAISIRTRNEPEPSKPAPRLHIEVSDTGIGIEPDVLSVIFDAFQQGESSTARRFGGLGLGLTISRSIVDAHHGMLSVSSEGRGRGSTFLIQLQSVPKPAEKTAPADQPAASQRDVPLRILLVEDDAATRRLLDRLLSNLGHEVTTAASAEAALEVAHSRDYELLISDIGLPGQSGLDVIKSISAIRPIPAIALTGYGMEEDVRRSREAGFTSHLTKPIDFNKLREMIRVAVP